MGKLILLAFSGIVLGQADSLSGGGGWVGAGLLGLVLSWLLLKHLPEKDRQTIELARSCNERFDLQQAAFIASHRDSIVAFRAETALNREVHEHHLAAMRDVVTGMTEFFCTRAEASAKRKGITT